MRKIKEEAENERGNSSGRPESFLGGVGLIEEPLTLTLAPEYRGEGTGTPAEFFFWGLPDFSGVLGPIFVCWAIRYDRVAVV